MWEYVSRLRHQRQVVVEPTIRVLEFDARALPIGPQLGLAIEVF